MNILMRLFDFDSGELRINDIDIRRYDPADLHSRTTALFQNFSKYNNASVRENTGLGQVSSMMDDEAVKAALQTAGASKLVDKMAAGLETRLESGMESTYFMANKLKEDRFRANSMNATFQETGQPARAALSGGEVRAHTNTVHFLRC
jgi:ABC-type sugar transport system ATPase subunit